MTDLDRRFSQLEISIRRLRFICGTLALALLGVMAMAAAPAPASKLTPSEIVMSANGRTVTLSARGIQLTEGALVTNLEPGSVEASTGNIQAQLKVETSRKASEAYVGVAVQKNDGPSSASLRVSNVENEDPSAQLLVASHGKSNVVMADTMLGR
jgi:hypothetical protein